MSLVYETSSWSDIISQITGRTAFNNTVSQDN